VFVETKIVGAFAAPQGHFAPFWTGQIEFSTLVLTNLKQPKNLFFNKLHFKIK
jgi:hypothetical protein